VGYLGGKLAPWFDDSPNDRWLRAMVRFGAMQAADVAEKNTPVDTGDLRENWQVGRPYPTMTFLGMAWKAEWFNDLEYAAYVDQGTGLYGPEHRKYLIVPKKPGGTLHWVDRLTGQDRFAKFVMHPGSPGQHMIAISASVLESTWQRWVQPLLRGWARQVERQNPYARIT
jgi:hypothetical protein